MEKASNSRAAEYLFLGIILCIAAFLFLFNLGNQYLWQDEAETACVSRTILKHGIPLGYDGRNFFSQITGDCNSSYVWRYHPWLPFYILAAFFKLFGISTFIARLPFALFGVATVILAYFFAKLITKDKKTAALTTILLMISVPFIILSRQCRYYAPTAFFSLLGLYGYLLLLEKSRKGSIILTVSAALLFQSNYVSCAILLVTIFTHALIFHRPLLAKVLIICLIVVSVNIPWLILASGMKYDVLYSHGFFGRDFSFILKDYLLNIHYYVFPYFLLLIPLGRAVYLYLKHKSIKAVVPEDMFLRENLLLLSLFIVYTIAILTIMSPTPFFRYLSPLIPVFCAITAIIITTAANRHFTAVISTAGVLFVATFLADYRYEKVYPDRQGIKYLNIFDYLDEITHDYDGPIEGIVKYLNKHGSKDDIVVVTGEDLPLKFYTDMRIVRGYTAEVLSPARQAKWIIHRKCNLYNIDKALKAYQVKNLRRKDYDAIEIDYPDIPDENRESPAEHHFRTILNEDRVVIYKKLN